MKKQLILLTTILATTIALFFACCQNSAIPSESLQTDLDRLLASPEYQELSDEIHQFSIQTAQALFSLSPDKQKRMDEICATIFTSKDQEDFKALAKEMFALLNVDYEQHSKKMNELSQKTFKGQKFTIDEISQALLKHSQLQSSTPSTKSEEPPVTTTPYEACINGCQSSLNAQKIICNTAHKHETKDEEDKCELEREVAAVICQKDCENKYKTPPSEPETPTTPQDSTEKTEPPVTPIDPVEPTLPPTTRTR